MVGGCERNVLIYKKGCMCIHTANQSNIKHHVQSQNTFKIQSNIIQSNIKQSNIKQ